MDPLPTTDPPTLASLQATLVAHDERSSKRYKKLKGELASLEASYGGGTMDGTQGSTQVHHMYAGGAGGSDMSGAAHAAGLAGLSAMAARGGMNNMGAGFGLGGAALGFIAGALINNGGGGLFGNRGVGAGDVVTTAHLQSALNQQSQAQNTNSIMQQLAAIQQLIPENEGRVQNAIAQAQIALMNQGAQGQLQVAAVGSNLQNNIADARHSVNDNVHILGTQTAAGFGQVARDICDSTAATNAIVRQAKDTSEAGFAATQLGLANLGLQAANNTSAILTAIRDDGDKTRAQAAAINDATLNRIIVNQANEIIELKGDRNHHQRARETELTITQNVNQNQAQAQQQQQQQQQFLLLSNISAALNGLTQIAHATNQNVIAGNTGAVTTGPQNANPVNVA